MASQYLTRICRRLQLHAADLHGPYKGTLPDSACERRGARSTVIQRLVLRVCVATTACGDILRTRNAQTTCPGRINMLGHHLQIENACVPDTLAALRCGSCGHSSAWGLHVWRIPVLYPFYQEWRVICRSISEHGSPAFRDLITMRSLFAHRCIANICP